MPNLKLLLTGVLTSIILAGCGGGGGGGSSSADEAPPATAAPASEQPSVAQPTAPPAPVQPAPETPIAPDQPTTEPEDEAPVNTTVTLKWTAPSSRENGTPLLASEIKGYEIYYCKDDCEPEGSGTTVAVPGSPTSYEVTLDEVGTWHFAVAVIDLDDLKSPLSNTVSVVVSR